MKTAMVWCAAILAAVGSGCKAKDKGEGDNTAAKTAPSDKMAGSDTARTGAPGATAPDKVAPPAAVTGDDLAKRYVECWGYWKAKDFANLQSCYSKDATSENVDAGPAVQGAQAIIDADNAMAAAFPDRTGAVEITLINGKNGATVALLTGTHTGTLKTPMGDVPATNKKIGMQAAHTVHFTDDGKTVDKEVLYQDMGELMGQLGLSKAPVRKVLDKPFQDNEIVVAKDDANEKRNLESASKGLDTFNKHDAKAMAAGFADNLTWSESGVPKDWNKAEAIKAHDELFKAFPDLTITPDSQWAAGDYVVTTGTFAGTNKGDAPSMGLKKTGKPVSIHFAQVFKFDNDGKMTNSWGFWNSAAYAQQLGLAPPPKK